MNRLYAVMGVASLNLIAVPRFFYFFFYLFIYLYNCLNIILNQFLIIWVAPYAIELVHSVVSRISVFVFANFIFKGHFV